MQQFFHIFFRTLSCVAGLVAHGVMFFGVCYYLLTTPPEVLSGPGGLGVGIAFFYYCLACGALGIVLALMDKANKKGWFAALGFLLCVTPFISGIAAAYLVSMIQM